MSAQPKLDFNRELYDRRDAILCGVWEKVQPYVGRAVSVTRWKTRNRAVALDLARLGFTAERVVRAWELASTEWGEPVREISYVQRFIEKAAANKAIRDREKGAHG